MDYSKLKKALISLIESIDNGENMCVQISATADDSNGRVKVFFHAINSENLSDVLCKVTKNSGDNFKEQLNSAMVNARLTANEYLIKTIFSG